MISPSWNGPRTHLFDAPVVTTDVANESSLRYSGPTPRSVSSRCDRSSLPEQHEPDKKRPCDPIFLNIHPAIEFLGSNLWHLLSNAVNPSSAFAKNGAVDTDNFVVGEDFAENANWAFVFFTTSGDGDKNAFVADVKVHVR
jgi:hypothetical protein